MAISGKNIVGEEAALPSSYRVSSIMMTSHDGSKSLDIQNIVVEMNLQESLYSNTLYFDFSIKESSALFETFPIIGQETIRLDLDYYEFEGERKDLSLNFIVLDIPTYGKTQAQHSQVYKIQCISPEIYNSSFKKISRAFTSLTSSEIEKIYSQDLDIQLETSGSCVSKSKGVIPWQYPIRAAEWLRTQSFDDKFSPFFLYQTISGSHYLSSLTSLFNKEVYEEFFDSSDYNKAPLSKEDYTQRKQRMMEISSDMKMQKVNQSMEGVFASRNGYLDWATKTYSETVYNYENDYNTDTNFQNKKMLSKSFQVNGKVLSDHPDSHREHVSINTMPFSTTASDNSITSEANCSSLHQKAKHYLNAYNGALNTNVHDITVSGDFNMNPGTVIQLNFQRSVDPSVAENDELFDRHLSGKFLVISAMHKFKDNEYFTSIRVKRDGFEIDV
tara:strand:- start:245 stop:1576 length:1332 start_codon:yes stop_codon:yes gene_type:complete